MMETKSKKGVYQSSFYISIKSILKEVKEDNIFLNNDEFYWKLSDKINEKYTKDFFKDKQEEIINSLIGISVETDREVSIGIASININEETISIYVHIEYSCISLIEDVVTHSFMRE